METILLPIARVGNEPQGEDALVEFVRVFRYWVYCRCLAMTPATICWDVTLVQMSPCLIARRSLV